MKELLMPSFSFTINIFIKYNVNALWLYLFYVTYWKIKLLNENAIVIVIIVVVVYNNNNLMNIFYNTYIVTYLCYTRSLYGRYYRIFYVNVEIYGLKNLFFLF